VSRYRVRYQLASVARTSPGARDLGPETSDLSFRFSCPRSSIVVHLITSPRNISIAYVLICPHGPEKL
jgi:hypothetical protein